MNDLYLIGNGFDLAHGLKTSYNDFLLWYLNNFLEIYRNNNYPDQYEDDLLRITKSDSRYRIPDFASIHGMLKYLKENRYTLKAKSNFFQKIIDNYRDYRWVDIEYEYYSDLVNWYKQVELNPQNRNSIISVVVNLNACFDSIKMKLIEYLKTIDINFEKRNQFIENILLEENGPRGNKKGDKLYVYFNYTNTMNLYSHNFLPNNHLVYIHGDLFDESNPIIFGYGDELDPHYEKIENLNSNDFLRNIKSFSYFKTNNYQRVLRFMDSSRLSFTVKILGHSCGLSDRILLNAIFEHPKCRAIKIHYYQKNENENDYFEKTQEISRHFKSSAKGEMREKIISFERSSPLLPFRK